MEAGFLAFWLRFGSVTGTCVHAPSPKPRQNAKNSRSEWLQYFFNRLEVLPTILERAPAVPHGCVIAINTYFRRPYACKALSYNALRRNVDHFGP
jgi:hypothetical protein